MPQSTGPADSILIVAPHPDDETLNCGGVIQRTRRSGGSVRVVFLTNGDGFVDATALHSGKAVDALIPQDYVEVARARQEAAADAGRNLGLDPADLVLLGYPDGGLAEVLKATTDAPFTQPFTRLHATYGPRFQDYHTARYGAPAPYTARSILSDLGDQIREHDPRRIYVTDPADSHADHRAAFELTRTAMRAVRSDGWLYTFLVHTAEGRWPMPHGATPTLPFAVEVVDGEQVPAGVRWPPDHRFPLTAEEIRRKHEAIRAYALEMRILGPYVESFVKSEEVFWGGSRVWRGGTPA